MSQKEKLKTVFMDESGNRESDRFFIVGFLEVADVVEFNSKLYRIKDQIFHRSSYNRRRRVARLYQDRNIDELYKFAQTYSRFELKFTKVSNENLNLFLDLIKVLFSKIDFQFNALVIDREDKYYKHSGMGSMYKALIHLYSEKCIREDFVFVPDMFDPKFNWYGIGLPSRVRTIIPESSDASFPLQVVDVLTGIVGLGLRFQYTNERNLSKADMKRRPVLDCFERLTGAKVERNFTVNQPRYISVWTIDFSKKKGNKKGVQSMDKKPNFDSSNYDCN